GDRLSGRLHSEPAAHRCARRARRVAVVIPVFDGHNDALTCSDHDRLATGRENGHLDLPRMYAGGVRGGIFAVFTSSGDDESWDPVQREDGALAVTPSSPVPHH